CRESYRVNSSSGSKRERRLDSRAGDRIASGENRNILVQLGLWSTPAHGRVVLRAVSMLALATVAARGEKMAKEMRREDRTGLYCVELRTEKWAEMVEWYRQALGLRVLVRVLDDGYALLEAGETRLALLKRASSGEATPRISLAFEVNDMT